MGKVGRLITRPRFKKPIRGQTGRGVGAPDIPLKYYGLSSDGATDCDDLVAFGMQVRAIKQDPSKRLIAVVIDSPVPWAAPAFKAVLEAYDLADVPVGAYKGATGPTTSTYAASLAYVWGHGGETRDDYPSASTVLRTALDGLPDGAKATMITIGMLGALYEFVQSVADEDGIAATGAELFSNRVQLVVNQGPNWANTFPRYNWEQNEAAAEHFCVNADTYGVPWVILPADEGDIALTGPPVSWSQYNNPIKRAFAMSVSQLTPATVDGKRQAWDPLTVYYAINPDNPMWAWHRERCSVTYDTVGNAVTKGAAESGMFSWINLNGTGAAIGAELDAYLAGLDAYQVPAAPFIENAGYAVLDFPFEGADGSVVVIDVTTDRAATVSGATIEDDFAEAGGISSLYIPAVGYAELADSADWHFGSAPFTIQLRGVRLTNLAAARTMINQWFGNVKSWALEVNTLGVLGFYHSVDGTVAVGNLSAAGTITAGVSYDIDVVRTAGNDIKTFVNGVQVYSGNIGAVSLYNSTTIMRVGLRSDGINGFIGYIGRARILKGVGVIPA